MNIKNLLQEMKAGFAHRQLSAEEAHRILQSSTVPGWAKNYANKELDSIDAINERDDNASLPN